MIVRPNFRHLVKIGRHRINVEKIIRIEDLTQAQSAGAPAYAMVLDPGDTLTFAGDDARELRRLLDDSDAQPEGEACHDDASPGRTLSGHGPGPLVRPLSAAGPDSVAE
jgi:hypothetical protein